MNKIIKKRLRILIVEDEILTAKSLFQSLKDFGYDPMEPLLFGEKAIETAIKEHPDVILMDIRLAGAMDGIEAAKKIHDTVKIPVFFMSGYATKYIKEKAASVEYIEFLEKPLNVENLIPYFENL